MRSFTTCGREEGRATCKMLETLGPFWNILAGCGKTSFEAFRAAKNAGMANNFFQKQGILNWHILLLKNFVYILFWRIHMSKKTPTYLFIVMIQKFKISFANGLVYEDNNHFRSTKYYSLYYYVFEGFYSLWKNIIIFNNYRVQKKKLYGNLFLVFSIIRICILYPLTLLFSYYSVIPVWFCITR